MLDTQILNISKIQKCDIWHQNNCIIFRYRFVSLNRFWYTSIQFSGLLHCLASLLILVLLLTQHWSDTPYSKIEQNPNNFSIVFRRTDETWITGQDHFVTVPDQGDLQHFTLSCSNCTYFRMNFNWTQLNFDWNHFNLIKFTYIWFNIDLFELRWIWFDSIY